LLGILNFLDGVAFLGGRRRGLFPPHPERLEDVRSYDGRGCSSCEGEDGWYDDRRPERKRQVRAIAHQPKSSLMARRADKRQAQGTSNKCYRRSEACSKVPPHSYISGSAGCAWPRIFHIESTFTRSESVYLVSTGIPAYSSYPSERLRFYSPNQ
jgi:hypothetical protein